MTIKESNGVLSLEIPGAGRLDITFDLEKKTSCLRYFTAKQKQEADYRLIEEQVFKSVKGRFPGSNKTKRLRKKRRKAVLQVYNYLRQQGKGGWIKKFSGQVEIPPKVSN